MMTIVCLYVQMDYFLFGAKLAPALLAEDALAAVHTVPLSVCGILKVILIHIIHVIHCRYVNRALL